MITNGYAELEKLPAEKFLDWEYFRTPNDGLPADDYAGKQYAKGLSIGERAKAVHISTTSVWSATMENGFSTFSYEGIGYHSCTAELLKGFIDSGCTIIVHRWTDTGIAHIVIQERAKVQA